MKRWSWLFAVSLLAVWCLSFQSGSHAFPPAAPGLETAEIQLPAGVPAKVGAVLAYIDEHGSAPPGYVGGRVFTNDGRNHEEVLPRTDADGDPITYHEYDVNRRVPGRNRGVERLVIGDDGSAYFTADHYQTFTAIRGQRLQPQPAATAAAPAGPAATHHPDATGLPEVGQIPPGAPANLMAILDYITTNGRPMPRYVGGRVFENRGGNGAQRLPRVDADGQPIQYHEWDVHPRVPGQNRGTQRLVTGSDGTAWYTGDHYRTFVRIR